ncbi:MAG: hypothetical protein E7293_07860 [Lachnospiraceae bacterium]|nr:hypothetical protein [Lachnospiraceae bacterium]
MNRAKGKLSVLGLLVRISIYKVLTVLVIMSMVQVALFARVLQSTDGQQKLFESMIRDSYLSVISRVAFLALCLILVWTDSDRRGCKSSYLLKRLCVSRPGMFALRSIYYLGCFVIFGAVQIGLVIGMFFLYRRGQTPETLSPQALFLAFYRNDFLHSLLPLEETVRWIRNGFLLVCSSMQIAWFQTALHPAGKWIPVLWILYVVMTFPQGIGSLGMDIFTMVTAGVCVAFILTEVFDLWGRDQHGA